MPEKLSLTLPAPEDQAALEHARNTVEEATQPVIKELGSMVIKEAEGITKDAVRIELPPLPADLPDEADNKYFKADPDAKRREDKLKREQAAQDLLDKGYNSREVSSIGKNGYIMAGIYATEEPSIPALQEFAKREAKVLEKRQAAGEDITQVPADYASKREQMLLDNREMEPEQAERIVSLGMGYPAEYNPHFYQQLLEEKLAQQK